MRITTASASSTTADLTKAAERFFRRCLFVARRRIDVAVAFALGFVVVVGRVAVAPPPGGSYLYRITSAAFDGGGERSVWGGGSISSSSSSSRGLSIPTQPEQTPTTAAAKIKKTFTELLIESKSDKYERHHYEQYYAKWLEPYRSKPGVKVLELGARDGKSMQLWNEYFDDPSRIVGLAYGPFTQNIDSTAAELEKISILHGDQSKRETMDILVRQGPWDVVIDDASHVPQHVAFSLFSLWNSVEPGGIYVIEDLETSYWPHDTEIYGYHLNHTGIGAGAECSVVTKLEQIQQVLARHQIGAEELSVMPGDRDICSVEWGMNLVVLRKCESDVLKPPYQKKLYDARRMEDWIAEAKRTNPF